MEITSQRSFSPRWIIGGALIALGMLILLMNTGLIDRFPIWQFWPLVLIVIGINKFLQPFNRAEGFWLVTLGLWFQWSLLRLYGYGFGDTWPIVLILYGIYFMWESLERQSRKKAFDQTNLQTH